MRRWIDNTIEGNYKGRKTRVGKILPRYPRFDEKLKRTVKCTWVDLYRIGLRRNDWYKPKGNPTKRGNKRRQSKPR